MKRDVVLEKIRRAEPSLRALGVAGAALFGSLSRGDDRVDSDIDIAVRPAPGKTISAMALISIHGILGDQFDRATDIDVVVLPSVDPRLNAAIAKDAVIAFQ